MITQHKASQILQNHGFKCKEIIFIPEGHNHYVYEVMLENGENLMAKFNKPGDNRQEQRDSLFGGIKSAAREKAAAEILLANGIPAPNYHYFCAEFSLVEKLPGKLWSEYQKENKYTQPVFLDSLANLGKEIAKLHKVEFSSFGDVLKSDEVTPENQTDFSDRVWEIIQYRYSRAVAKNVFSPTEQSILNICFQVKLQELAFTAELKSIKPVMVLSDLHGDNFLVEEENVCGFFDLESCQAAHPALEIYGLKFFLFNYFEDSFAASEASFIQSYKNAGGSYDFKDPDNLKWENLLALVRIMELTESYYNVKDGLRDCWSDRFRRILFESIAADAIDYKAVGTIFREKTKQPSVMSSLT